MRDRDQFSHLARQVMSHDCKGLLQAYSHATEATHVYLLIDLSQDTDDSLRFQTCIFPNEAAPLLYVDIGNERIKANYHTLLVLKNGRPKLRKAIISN